MHSSVDMWPSPFAAMTTQRERGYSLVEAILVIGIILTLSAITVLNVRTMLRVSQVDAAYDLTLTAMRQARQSSLSERRIFVLTFTAPGTVLLQRMEQDGSVTTVNQAALPANIQFRTEPGMPTSSAYTPDNFGTGASAIDFNGANTIYFRPDGSARDAIGRINNGVIYIARPSELTTARAITLFGSTGRIKGWRLRGVGGIPHWE